MLTGGQTGGRAGGQEDRLAGGRERANGRTRGECRAIILIRRLNTAVRIKWYLPHKEVLARPTGERAGDKQMGGNLQQASRRGFRSDPRPATYIEGHAWVLIPEAYTLVLVGGRCL